MARAFPNALLHFVALFNAGDYWESHEVLEVPWREGRSGFYHGLILYASAFVHARRQNPRGVAAQLAKAEWRLARYRPHYLGLDVDRILANATASRAHAAAGRWDVSPTHLVPAPALVRGDEPELLA